MSRDIGGGMRPENRPSPATPDWSGVPKLKSPKICEAFACTSVSVQQPSIESSVARHDPATTMMKLCQALPHHYIRVLFVIVAVTRCPRRLKTTISDQSSFTEPTAPNEKFQQVRISPVFHKKSCQSSIRSPVWVTDPSK